MPVSWPSLKTSFTAYMPTGSTAVTFTSRLPTCSTSCPGPWPRTSAEGENTRRYSQGREKLSPSSNVMSSTRETWCRLISVGFLTVRLSHPSKMRPMVGILIVSHGAFGESLIHSASHVLGKRPLYLRQLGVTVHDDPDALIPVAEDLIRFLDQGAGVLVLTDIYGATPSNIAARLLRPGRVEGLAGVNLPMLIRALTYRESSALMEVRDRALAGATEGVVRMGTGDGTQ